MGQVLVEHPEVSVRSLCELFGVSRSWYYDKPDAAEKAQRDVELRDAIERIVLEFPGYGYRRVTEQLRREEWDVNHKRVLRVMRQESLLCQLKKGFVATTDSSHSHRTYPNLLEGFALNSLHCAWVADITYIRLPTCFVYLAVILDAYSRKCIGWSLSRFIDARLTLAALRMALRERQPPRGFIHHSDRGVQYASHEYIQVLESAGARISMSGKGNPYDNAKAESFFKTLKREEVYLKEYRSLEEADANIGHFIEDVYNNKRLHSSLGYLPPVEFETAQIEKLTCIPVR
jgi:transposase InsO family protein